MRDVGTIVIHLAHGMPVIARSESGVDGSVRLVEAENTAAFDAEVRRVLAAQGVPLSADGLYPCPLHLQEAAQFAPLVYPSDLITLAAARDLLYPDINAKTGWARVHQDVAKGRLRAYWVGMGMDAKRFVSRADVQARVAPAHASVMG